MNALYHVAIAMLLLGGASTAMAAAGTPLDALDAHVPSRYLLRFETEGTVQFAKAAHTKYASAFRLRCTCLRDGERLDVRTLREDDGKPILAWRSIINGWYLAYEEPPVGKLAVGGLFALSLIHI